MPAIAKAVVAAVIAVPFLITACSSGVGSPLAGSSSPAGATASAEATASANPSAGTFTFTGARLKAMLEPRSFFPKAFAPDPGGSVNTGDGYQPATAPGKLPCSRLGSTAWVDLSDIGSVSFAQSDFIDKPAIEEYAQEIDVYPGATAQAVLRALRKLPARCSGYKDPQTGGTVTVTLGRGPAIGNASLSLLLSSPVWQGGTTLEAVRVGQAVVTVLYSADSGTGAKQASALARILTTRVISASR